MAELVGAAEIRVDMRTTDAVRSLQRMVARADGPLRQLKRRVSDVRQELGRLRGTSVAVTVDDRTGQGVAAVRAAVRDLERLGPVRVRATVDVQAADITAASSAMGLLENAADGASRALRTLRTRTVAVASALGNLTERAVAAGFALRTLAAQANMADGRMGSLGDGTRRLRGDMDDLDGRVLGVTDRLGGLGSTLGTVGSQAGQAAGGGAGLAAALKGVGAAAAVTALPALGALVPMLVGVGAAGGVVALAFDDIKKQAKRLKPEFEDLQQVASKAVMPGVKSFFTDLKPAISGLSPAVKVAGEALSGLARSAGQFVKSEAFQSAFFKNVQLGSKWFGEFGQSVLKLGQALLDFGAASKPTLDAFGGGLNDLLGKGLPGFFEGLQTGVKGSAEMFTGLFGAVNKVLPAFGELAGAVSNAVGPALRELFESAGTNGAGAFRSLADAVGFLKPVFGEVGGTVRIASIALQTAGRIAKDVGTVLISSLWPSFRKAKDAVGPLQRLAGWLKDNDTAVREFSRKASAAIIDFVSASVSALPDVIRAFRLMSSGVFIAMGTIVKGAALAFGWIPGVGDKLKTAERSFDEFREAFMGGLTKAEEKSRSFAEKVGPRLEKNKLKMNISNWNAQLEEAKKRLRDPKLTDPERTKIRATIADLKKKIAAGKKGLRDPKLTDPKATKIRATIADLKSKIASGKKRLRNKNLTRPERTQIRANIRDLQRKVAAAKRRLNGLPRHVPIGIGVRVTSNTSLARTMALLEGRAQGGLIGYAGGGKVQGYPHGGRIRGPGTSTSDSIPIMASRGEFMIREAAVRRYGQPLFEALNAMKVPTATRSRARTPDLSRSVGTTTTAARRRTSSEPRPLHVTVNVENRGVLGSQRDVENWFVKTIDHVNRTGRMPKLK